MARDEMPADRTADSTDGRNLTLTRRAALALLGVGGFAATTPGIAGASQHADSGTDPTRAWNQNIDAQHHDLFNLHGIDVEHVFTAARDADRIVWKDADGVFHADGVSGEIASGEDILTVTQAAVNSLTEGRDWKETVAVVSSGETTGEADRINLPSYTVLDVPAEIHVPHSDGSDYSETVDHIVFADDVEHIEIPRLTVTGAPWMAVRIRQSSNVKIGDFRFLASKGSQTSDGLRIDNKRGAGRSEDVQINSVYVENGGHHGVEMVDVHRFQAEQVIGKDVSGTALILNKSTDATVNSVIGLNTGSEEEAYATFRLANYNENISVSNVVSRGGYRGMAIITDARHVTVGEVNIVGPKLNGIQLVDAQNVSINGGVIRNCGDSAVTIYSHLGEPANEGISVNNVRIVDDRPEGEREQSWAFTETDNSRYNRFVNNDIRGGGTEGLIRVGSETTVIRDNTGGGLASGKATLESGASPAARIEGVEDSPGSTLSARVSLRSDPGGTYAVTTDFVWDGEDEEWDLLFEWGKDPGRNVDVVYVVDRNQPNVVQLYDPVPREWDADSVDEEPGVGTIDDFEDGNMDEYVGSTGAYKVNDANPVPEGTFSMKNTDGGDALIGSFDGLARYPSAGETFAAKVAQTDATSTMGVAFGMQDLQNFYFTRFWGDGNNLQLYKVDGGKYTKLADSGGVSGVKTGKSYRFVIDWGTDGTIRVELRDAGGSVVVSVSHTDVTFTDGGIGTRRSGVLDDMRIL